MLDDSPILTLMLSAGLGGGILGAGAKALSPALRKSKNAMEAAKSIGKAGATAGALSAPLVGAGGAIGQGLMGEPDAEEISTDSPWTKRAAIGGLLGGGAIGATLGGLQGAGKLRALSALLGKKINPEIRSVIRGGIKELPSDNVLVDKFRKLGQKPGTVSAGKGALLGGGILGGLAGYQGMDEGMQADVLAQELQRRKGV